MHKHLDKIDSAEPKLVEDLVKFFYSVFKARNVQFCGFLHKEGLKDSWENAMEKLASESVYRSVSGRGIEIKKHEF